MRKIKLFLTALIFGIVASASNFAWGGVKPSKSAALQAEENGVELSECYAFRFDAEMEEAVYYYTASQANLRAPKIQDGDKNIYYIAASEAPTRVSFFPKSGYGIASVVASGGNQLDSYPAGVYLYTSKLSVGELYDVTIKPMNEVRCGTMTVTVDNPDQIRVQQKTGYFTRTYLADSFVDNKLTINYDPNTETSWTVSHDGCAKIYRATVNGTDIPRTEGSIYITNTSIQYQPYMQITPAGATTDVNVTVDFPDNEIPLKVRIIPTSGSNETNQSKLNDIISAVKVNKIPVDRDLWENGTLMVKNGSDVTIGFGNNKLYYAYINGVRQKSFFSFLIESTEDVPTPQEITVEAVVINPLRCRVVSDNFDKFDFYIEQDRQDIASSDHNITAEALLYSYASVRTRPDLNYKVRSVKVNGENISEKRPGHFEFKPTMDMVVEVVAEPYVRDKKMRIYNDVVGADLILDPDGVMYKRLPMQYGFQEIAYNDEDLPVRTDIGDPYIYHNGDFQTVGDEGLFLASYKEGDDVKIFAKAARRFNLTYEAMNATITHDGKPVAAGQTYSVLQGTMVKVVPTTWNASYVLQTGKTTFATKNTADKCYEFVAQSSGNVSLHPDNPRVTIKLEGNDDAGNPLYKRFTVAEGNETYTLTGATTELVLPYYADKSTYTLTLRESSHLYSIDKVTATPTGATLNATAQTISGVKGGMTLTLTAAKIAKPYSCNINIKDPGNGNSCYFFIRTQNQDPDNDFMGMGQPLQYGDNNVTTNDALQFEDSDFPITIAYVAFMGNYLYGGEYGGEDVLVLNHKCTVKTENDLERDDSNPEAGPSLLNYKYTIDTPQNVNLTIRNIRNDQWSPIFVEAINSDFLFSVDGGDFTKYTPEAFDYQINYGAIDNFYLYNEDLVHAFENSVIRIKAPEGETLKKVTVDVKYAYTPSGQPSFLTRELEPDADGIYTFTYEEAPNYSFDTSSFIYLTVEGESVNFGAQTDSAFGSVWAEIDGIKNYLEFGFPQYFSVGVKTPIKVFTTSAYTITEIVDSEGNALDYDEKTGIVTGVTEGMEFTVKLEEYVRDHQFTVYYPVSSTNFSIAPTLYLAKDTPKESPTILSTSKAASKVIKYNVADLPIAVTNTNIKNNASTVADIYLNDEKIAYSAESGYDFPGYMPENAIIRINVPKSGFVTATNLTYEIDPDIYVVATQDGREVTTESTTGQAAVGCLIKVQAQNGVTNKYDYAVTYSVNGGDFQAMPAAGVNVTSSQASMTIRVAKTYNTITVNGAEGTDITKLRITADGEEYPVAPGDNVISIPTHVKELTIVTTEAEKYVDSVDGLTFDKNTGSVTDLKTATVTVDVKQVERPMEVTVYVDGEELAGGSIVLGNGKVIETNAEVGEGYNTVYFSEDDLPIIYRLDAIASEGGSTVSPAELPTVYVNGEQLEYSAEHGGYVFPVEALTSGVAPVIKIYPPVPEGVEPVAPVKLTYLIEPGISFKATEDHVTEVTEGGMRDVLPGTEIAVEASADNGDDIFVEVDGNRVAAADGKYTFAVGNTDMAISVKFEKLEITLKSDEWHHVRIAGGGLEYPMYDVNSTLQFPQKTSEFTVTTTSVGSRVTGVNDGDGNPLPFDVRTGKLTGVTAGMTLEVVLDEYKRDIELMVYLEETEEEAEAGQPVSHLVLAAGTTVEKSVELVKGYQTVTISNEDLPLAVTTAEGVEAVVFLNNEQLEKADGEYKFPAEMPESSVVKIFTAGDGDEIARAEVSYDFSTLTDFAIELHHDHVATAVDATATHRLLPGTEITFTVTPKAKPAPARVGAITPKDGEAATEPAFTVTANDEEVEPQEDGSYMVKINDDHIANGLSLKVAQPQTEDPEDPNTGIDEVMADGATADVYSISGTLIVRKATKADIAKLPAGIYIIGGEKVVVR